MDIKIFIHVHFKWVENHRHFNIFNFSSDVYNKISHWTITSDIYNKFHIELSQQYYPEDITHETHTTKTTRDHEDDGIRRYHTR